MVYDDRNGNGTLDLLDASATSEIDALVGARGDLEVWYVAGGVPRTGDQDGGGRFDFLELGYQVVVWDEESGRAVESLELPLVVDERVRSIVCADPFGAPFEIADKGTTPPAAYPVEGDFFACYPDGTRFEWDREGCKVTHWDYLCPPNVMCHLETYWIADPAAPPAGWPCEVTWTPPE